MSLEQANSCLCDRTYRWATVLCSANAGAHRPATVSPRRGVYRASGCTLVSLQLANRTVLCSHRKARIDDHQTTLRVTASTQCSRLPGPLLLTLQKQLLSQDDRQSRIL